MNHPISAVWPGTPFPRGANWDGEGVNFAIFSENATRVDLVHVYEQGDEPLRSMTAFLGTAWGNAMYAARRATRSALN